MVPVSYHAGVPSARSFPSCKQLVKDRAATRVCTFVVKADHGVAAVVPTIALPLTIQWWPLHSIKPTDETCCCACLPSDASCKLCVCGVGFGCTLNTCAPCRRVLARIGIRPSGRHDAAIWDLAGPAVLALAADPLLGVVDTAFVGRLGPEALVRARLCCASLWC